VIAFNDCGQMPTLIAVHAPCAPNFKAAEDFLPPTTMAQLGARGNNLSHIAGIDCTMSRDQMPLSPDLHQRFAAEPSEEDLADKPSGIKRSARANGRTS